MKNIRSNVSSVFLLQLNGLIFQLLVLDNWNNDLVFLFLHGFFWDFRVPSRLSGALDVFLFERRVVRDIVEGIRSGSIIG